MDLLTILEYHNRIQPNSTIAKIIEAIIDKENGLGLLWMTAKFNEWFAELDYYPANFVIGQHRDFLKEYLHDLTT